MWFRGRAGCGKSMLMDYLSQEHAPTQQTHVCLSFAFQQECGGLKCSPLGVFRSLLHQVLRENRPLLARFMEITKFQQRCDERGLPGEKWNWTLAEVQSKFTWCLNSYHRERPIRIYLDAIDEAGEEAATSIISYFQHRLKAPKAFLSICFSSRPYPFVNVGYDFAISIQDENTLDVEALVDYHLDKSQGRFPGRSVQPIRSLLVKAFRGNPLLLERIVPKVVRSIAAQESSDMVWKALKEIPKGFDQIYMRDLDHVPPQHSHLAFEVFKWSRLSMDPLPLEELRIAMCVGNTDVLRETSDLKSSTLWYQDVDLLLTRVELFSADLLRVLQPSLDFFMDQAQERPAQQDSLFLTMDRSQNSCGQRGC